MARFAGVAKVKVMARVVRIARMARKVRLERLTGFAEAATVEMVVS